MLILLAHTQYETKLLAWTSYDEQDPHGAIYTRMNAHVQSDSKGNRYAHHHIARCLSSHRHIIWWLQVDFFDPVHRICLCYSEFWEGAIKIAAFSSILYRHHRGIDKSHVTDQIHDLVAAAN